MKVNKPTENWTKFPNCILDNLEEFNPYEFKILGLMVRKTLGYSDPNCQFSIRYLVQKLGISKSKVIESLKSLEESETIIVIGTGKRGIKLYNVNWSVTKTSPPQRPELVSVKDLVKENISVNKYFRARL